MEKVDGCWRVFNKETGQEHAKCTTKRKAEAQLRLLRGVEHGFKPTGQPAKPMASQTWRQYYAEQVKGKKFASRAEVNDFMRATAKKYRESK